MAGEIRAKVVDEGFCKYPWEEWIDGKWREVDVAEMKVSESGFRGSVYKKARSIGKKAEFTRQGNKVRFRIFEKENE